MNLIKSEELITIFTLLNEGKLNYILMRNINNEIPSNVEIKKDIDILVKYQDKVSFINFFKQNNFQQISHPHKDNIFLYGVEKFEFYKNISKMRGSILKLSTQRYKQRWRLGRDVGKKKKTKLI